MAKPQIESPAMLRLRAAVKTATEDYAACAPIITASVHKIAHNRLDALDEATKRGRGILDRAHLLTDCSEQWLDAHTLAITTARQDVTRTSRVIGMASARNAAPGEALA